MAIRLRHKLFFVYLALLAVPWAGCQSISGIETSLRQDKENALLATARATALVIQDQAGVFAQYQAPVDEKRDHYAHHLKRVVQVDGYVDDWQDYTERAKIYDLKNASLGSESSGAPDMQAQVLLGLYKPNLYMLIQVRDKKIVYRDLNHPDPNAADHVRLFLDDGHGRLRTFYLATEAPGWVAAQELISQGSADEPPVMRAENNIRGEWQETHDGYTMELRLPVSMVGRRLGFAVADVNDRQDRTVQAMVGTAANPAEALGYIMLPETGLENALQHVSQAQTRVWVIDNHRRVLAIAGSLSAPADPAEFDAVSMVHMIIQIFYNLVLHRAPNEFQDDLFGANRLQGEEITAALAGKSATRWRRANTQSLSVLSAAQPVRVNGQILGAVVAEQTNRQILSTQNRALEQYFNYGLVVMTFAILLLAWFATRLSNRIRHLRNQIDHAITHDGQVVGTIQSSSSGDELGDLGRSFADMLERLTQYTHYLESMAGKLSHELRTPLTVVKSSLENLECTGISDESKVYLERAKEGAQRLGTILTGLSEATRLEQSLQASEKEDFNLVTLVQSCVEGYKLAYSHVSFELNMEQESLTVHGVPELIAQLLDKLVSNAISFTVPDKPIIVSARRDAQSALLQVSNSGPLLPEQKQGVSVFDSMVSLRKNKSDTPHLGLGLYIARLIASYHNGQVRADNRDDGSGVVFSIWVPLLQNAP